MNAVYLDEFRNPNMRVYKLKLLTPHIVLVVVIANIVAGSVFALKHWTEKTIIQKTGNDQTT